MIPANRFSHIAQQDPGALSRAQPPGELSNGNVGGEGIFRNYVRQQDRKFDRNNYDFKVNYNLSPSNQVWGKYSRMGADVTRPRRTWVTTAALPATRPCRSYTFGTRGR